MTNQHEHERDLLARIDQLLAEADAASHVPALDTTAATTPGEQDAPHATTRPRSWLARLLTRPQ